MSFNLRRIFQKPRAEPSVQTGIVAGVRRITTALRAGRRSSNAHNSNVNDLLGTFGTPYTGHDHRTRASIIREFRALANTDDDVGGSARDIIALAITDISWEAFGTDAAIEQAEDVLDAFRASVFPTGLTGLAEHQARELYLTGASSLEWVPTEALDGVAYAAPVPAETIHITQADDGTRAYYQIPRNGTFTTTGQTIIELDSRTYKYVAQHLDGDSPYGVPPILSSLRMLARKHTILDGEDRLIKAAQNLALVTAEVATPDAASLGCESVDSPEYQQAYEEYMAAIADLLAAGSENGLYVHPEGITLATTRLQQNLQGTPDISEKNQKLIWSGLGTQGYLRGDLSANYALARVIHPQVLAFARSLRRSVSTALEFGLNLHLQLQGVPAFVEVSFNEPDSPFKLDDAQTELTLAQADKLMLELVGPAWLGKISARTGISEDELRTTEGQENEETAE